MQSYKKADDFFRYPQHAVGDRFCKKAQNRTYYTGENNDGNKKYHAYRSLMLHKTEIFIGRQNARQYFRAVKRRYGQKIKYRKVKINGKKQ